MCESATNGITSTHLTLIDHKVMTHLLAGFAAAVGGDADRSALLLLSGQLVDEATAAVGGCRRLALPADDACH